MPFDDQDAFEDFQLAHALAHDSIAQSMFANSLIYNAYPLDETPRWDKDWLETHQQEHQSIFFLLDMTGLPDLVSYARAVRSARLPTAR